MRLLEFKHEIGYNLLSDTHCLRFQMLLDKCYRHTNPYACYPNKDLEQVYGAIKSDKYGNFTKEDFTKVLRELVDYIEKLDTEEPKDIGVVE